MKYYIAEIDLPALAYADMFLVKAENKKIAQQKVYDYCKESFNYKKVNILIYSLEDYYKDNENDVAEIH